LDMTGEPYVFFEDPETGRGAVAYRRYDGHYGVIVPADEEPEAVGGPDPGAAAEPRARRSRRVLPEVLQARGEDGGHVVLLLGNERPQGAEHRGDHRLGVAGRYAVG